MAGCRPAVPGPQSGQDRSHIPIASVRPSQPPAFASMWVHHQMVAAEVVVEEAVVDRLGHPLHLVPEAAAAAAAVQGPAAKAEVEEGVAWPARGGMVRRCHNHLALAMMMRSVAEAEGTSMTDLRTPRWHSSARTPCLRGTVSEVEVCKTHRGYGHHRIQKARRSLGDHLVVVAEVFGKSWDCSRRSTATTSLGQLVAAAVYRTYSGRAGKWRQRAEVAEWEIWVRST